MRWLSQKAAATCFCAKNPFAGFCMAQGRTGFGMRLGPAKVIMNLMRALGFISNLAKEAICEIVILMKEGAQELVPLIGSATMQALETSAQIAKEAAIETSGTVAVLLARRMMEPTETPRYYYHDPVEPLTSDPLDGIEHIDPCQQVYRNPSDSMGSTDPCTSQLFTGHAQLGLYIGGASDATMKEASESRTAAPNKRVHASAAAASAAGHITGAVLRRVDETSDFGQPPVNKIAREASPLDRLARTIAQCNLLNEALRRQVQDNPVLSRTTYIVGALNALASGYITLQDSDSASLVAQSATIILRNANTYSNTAMAGNCQMSTTDYFHIMNGHYYKIAQLIADEMAQFQCTVQALDREPDSLQLQGKKEDIALIRKHVEQLKQTSWPSIIEHGSEIGLCFLLDGLTLKSIRRSCMQSSQIEQELKHQLIASLRAEKIAAVAPETIAIGQAFCQHNALIAKILADSTPEKASSIASRISQNAMLLAQEGKTAATIVRELAAAP